MQIKHILFVFLLIGAYCAHAQSNGHSLNGKIQDSLLLVYNYNVQKRPEVEKLLTDNYTKHRDLESKAFLEVLKMGVGIDERPLDELDKFASEIDTKYKGFPNVQARAYRIVAYHYFIGVFNYEKAFNAYFKLEQLLKKYDDTVIPNYADYCGEIVTAYYKFKNYKAAIQIAKIGLTKANNKWYLYNTIGLCYVELRRLETALVYLKQAVLEADRQKLSVIYRTIAIGNIGQVYYLKGDYKQAKPLFQIDLNEALKNNDFGLAAGAAVPLSDVLVAEKKYKEANELLESARAYIYKSGQNDRLGKFFPVKSRYYEAIGNAKLALAYRDSTIKAIVRNDSVFNGLLIMRAQQKSDLEKLVVEKSKLESYKTLSEIRMTALIAIFIIAVVFYLIVRRYRNRIETDKKRIEELNRIMELRQRLSADMHDDIGSTLSSISIYTHSLLMQPVAQHQQSTLEKIKENAQNVQESISDIIWSVNPNMDSMEQVVARMRSFGADITEYADVKFEFKTEAEVIHLSLEMGVRKNLYLIYKEAVNNAVKYSACSQITINLKSDSHCFEMSISDDGKGFDLEKMKSGNGIINMRRRAESIGAKFEILSLPQQGTRISLIVTLIS